MHESLLELSIPADTSNLKEIRDRIRNVTLTVTDCVETVDRIILAINEACMNVIQHAYPNDHVGIRDIVLELLRDGSTLIIQVKDHAPTCDPGTIKPRDLKDIRPGGLGVHFIREIMNEVDYLGQTGEYGNVLRMKINLKKC